MRKKYKLVRSAAYGYKKLDPCPAPEDLSRFYESKYYELIRKGGRAPELKRLLMSRSEGNLEKKWLCKTLYEDICYVLNQHSPGRKMMDVGCGTGEFASYLKNNKFDVVGIEPSLDAARRAKSKGLIVYNSTLDDFVKKHKTSNLHAFDAVILLNVLEHIPEPANIIKTVKMLLKPNGIICIRVPNDFTEMQSAAQKVINKKQWWVAIPDHINYFNFKTLHVFLEKMGFKALYSQGDFPMELFLLMGEDYVGDPVVGNKCHQKRVELEMALPNNLRRSMYKELGKVGVGRDCLVFGQLEKT